MLDNSTAIKLCSLNILDLDHDLGLHACTGYFKNERTSKPKKVTPKEKKNCTDTYMYSSEAFYACH